ncbi:hypothetical protein PNOK_0515200 [Pyrrhoderma noxium]|uniref:DUF6534 domain-containing protein n=1 Tax=Pyrrhoderma noxium TaxID=2282107 RepID=A0A286UKX1_9AGAM|nr:hypothetical protein PNOK_0515200 [Pyrrhoderma noxium]
MPPPGPPDDFGFGSIELVMAPLYLASVWSMGLWCLGTAQMYFYYSSYSKDPLWLKMHIFLIWTLNTLHQAFLIEVPYQYLIVNFGDRDAVAVLDRFLVASLLISAFACIMVQVIFVLRVWKLSNRNIPVTGYVLLLVLAQFAATCLYFGKAAVLTTFIDLKRAMPITRIVNGISAAADGSIAIILVFLLHRVRTGFNKRSETAISRLIAFTINTGLVTGLCSLLALITGIVLPNTLVFMFFYVLIGRLYMNSLFATLNSRISIRNEIFSNNSNSNNHEATNVTHLTDRFRVSPHSPSPPASRYFSTNLALDHERGSGLNQDREIDFARRSCPPRYTQHSTAGISVTVETTVGSPLDGVSIIEDKIPLPPPLSESSIRSSRPLSRSIYSWDLITDDGSVEGEGERINEGVNEYYFGRSSYPNMRSSYRHSQHQHQRDRSINIHLPPSMTMK